MKKLMPAFAAFLGGAFMIVVFATVMSLSFRGLGYIFPNDLFDQAIGLCLFDAAAIVWFLQFVYGSDSKTQYVAAGLGFLTGLIGMVGLVGIEVGISSGWLIASDMTKPLTYIFIAVTILHVIFIYLRHGGAPELQSKISLGIEKARIHDEGMRQAEQQLAQEMAGLGDTIRARLVDDVLRELNMQPRRPVIDVPALPLDNTLHVPTNGYPVNKNVNFFDDPAAWLANKFGGREKTNTAFPAPQSEPISDFVKQHMWDPNDPNDSPTATQHPWSAINHTDPRALPCGHIRGVSWDGTGNIYTCRICNQPVTFEDAKRVTEAIDGSRPAPRPKPAPPAAPRQLWRGETEQFTAAMDLHVRDEIVIHKGRRYSATETAVPNASGIFWEIHPDGSNEVIQILSSVNYFLVNPQARANGNKASIYHPVDLTPADEADQPSAPFPPESNG